MPAHRETNIGKWYVDTQPRDGLGEHVGGQISENKKKIIGLGSAL